jgi:hypothetical protein
VVFVVAMETAAILTEVKNFAKWLLKREIALAFAVEQELKIAVASVMVIVNHVKQKARVNFVMVGNCEIALVFAAVLKLKTAVEFVVEMVRAVLGACNLTNAITTHTLVLSPINV